MTAPTSRRLWPASVLVGFAENGSIRRPKLQTGKRSAPIQPVSEKDIAKHAKSGTRQTLTTTGGEDEHYARYAGRPCETQPTCK